MIPWHRLFGMGLRDAFAGTPWEVELELDLSVQQQFLDVLILRSHGGQMTKRPPDGLEDLAEHNLLTYKSLEQPLDDWSLKELTGHYVDYRKLVSPRGSLVPEERFRLFAVCTRAPRKLGREVSLEKLSPGVYEATRDTDRIRVIVLSEIPPLEHNVLWNLFSGIPDAVRFGADHVRERHGDPSAILNRLLAKYQLEGVTVPYTIEDFRRDAAQEMFEEMTREERAQLLQGLPAEERAQLLQGLALEEKLQMLRGLPREEVRALLDRLRSEFDGNGAKPTDANGND